MKFEQTIKIPKEKAKQINNYLQHEPTCEEECLHENETITNTATFPDNIEMDIKCCGVQYNKDESNNTAWTEAVLFQNGHEICCSEPADEYLGQWTLEYNDNEYTVIIEEEN